MNWFSWILIAWLALGPILIINDIGKPRQPLTPLNAIATLVIHGLVIAGIIYFFVK